MNFCGTFPVIGLLLTCTVCTILTQHRQTPIYTDNFILQLQDESKLPEVEKRHGLTCLTKILDEFHVCKQLGPHKRSTSGNELAKHSLVVDEDVIWFEQEKNLAGETELISDDCKGTPINNFKLDKLWYLNNSNGQPDVNVLGAWKKCFSGRGVKIAVVDGGIYRRQEFDINEELSLSDTTCCESFSHGTRVAGVVAANTTSPCCVGVAYGATLVDRPLFSDPNRGASEFVEALSRNYTDIDIFSNSWSALSTGVTIGNTDPLVELAIERGATQGRNGKGSIYVFGAGNGGEDDGCAYDAYSQSPYVIVAAGVMDNMRQLLMGENCSSVMVTAFSRDTDKRLPLITTEGKTNQCTTNFGYNSAAVPMVSGAIALALEANPDMTRRDIMHAIVNSSDSTLPFTPDNFFTNRAGYRVSQSFGFGLLDVSKLVGLAQKWRPVPKEVKCEAIFTKSVDIPNSRSILCFQNECSIGRLENVEVSFKLRFPRRGNIQMFLESPGGTVSTILPGRRWDSDPADSFEWKVVSVHFWGENPIGAWKLTTKARNPNRDQTGKLLEWSLRIRGTNETALHFSPADKDCNVTKEDSSPSNTLSPGVIAAIVATVVVVVVH